MLLHFDLSEFDSPDQKGSGEKMMDKDFVARLDRARGLARIPFFITSGYRTPSHNKKVGGVSRSAHCLGLAADILCHGSHDRYRIISALQKVGFTRFGIGKDFIHVDDDRNKPQGVMWDYYKRYKRMSQDGRYDI